MKTCELLGDAELAIPAYHADEFWSKRFVMWRSLQQVSALVIIVIFCVAAGSHVWQLLSILEKALYLLVMSVSLATTMLSPFMRANWMARVWPGIKSAPK